MRKLKIGLMIGALIVAVWALSWKIYEKPLLFAAHVDPVEETTLSHIVLKSFTVFEVCNFENNEITIETKDVFDDRLYHIQIATDNLFQDIVFNKATTDLNVHVCDLDRSVYYVRIKDNPLRYCFDWSDTIVLMNHEHIFIENKDFRVEPTCMNYGYEYLNCQRCDNVDKNQIDKLPHDFLLINTVDSKCFKKGLETYKCKDCGSNKFVELALAAHDYEKTNTVKSTCSKKGYIEYVCNVCSEKKTEELDYTKHNYKMVEKVNPTTSSHGYKKYSCSACDKSYTETIEKMRGGYVGNFKISSVGLDVPVYKRCEENGWRELQAITDDKNSAAIFQYHSKTVVADHKHQGFDKIKKASVGTTATFQGKTYTCISKFKGHNKKTALTDWDGNDIRSMEGSLVTYTCNENWRNVTILMWQ